MGGGLVRKVSLEEPRNFFDCRGNGGTRRLTVVKGETEKWLKLSFDFYSTPR